ncbi:flagellar basal body-associated protein FliL [Bacillus sp. GM2]|jgi:flagellar FliL protein|uniref:Flagellar protein FliL n=2 Tax=Bacillus paralicheniformis TaxID=1648923 RepID=A0A6I1MEK5_9BACI|nr:MULTISPECIES: flagellar basal body-associated protein FliL [Bacillus]ETB69735.1 flagellar basal body protein FliL [Bacillus sp. CPSM8]KUL07504.1 flagellar basal body protein FliL [Bacillus licheniformis LMG 7559]KUL19330.1 flagellar basal body protein FliL [Bacillus licheniformis LMG 6934]MBC8622633.1 flagellar basal body-associated protein FliL [Robertmurraya crescens]PDH71453.1 flagellar basal body-associated protein FliL [Bacillus licheniformis]POO82869.1 flagellar basal body-associated
MNKKLLGIMLTIILAIAVLGTAAFFVIKGSASEKDQTKEPSIDEVVESSVEVAEITTNLKSDNVVRLSIKLETDSKEAKEELEKRDFQIKDSVISLLANTNADDLEGQKGKEKFKEQLKEKLNTNYMKEGKVKTVYITSFNLQ